MIPLSAQSKETIRERNNNNDRGSAQSKDTIRERNNNNDTPFCTE